MIKMQVHMYYPAHLGERPYHLQMLINFENVIIYFYPA